MTPCPECKSTTTLLNAKTLGPVIVHEANCSQHECYFAEGGDDTCVVRGCNKTAAPPIKPMRKKPC